MRTLQIGCSFLSTVSANRGGAGKLIVPGYFTASREALYLRGSHLQLLNDLTEVVGTEDGSGSRREIRTWYSPLNAVMIFLWPVSFRVTYETQHIENYARKKEVPIIAFLPPEPVCNKELSQICIGVRSDLYHRLPWPRTESDFEAALRKAKV